MFKSYLIEQPTAVELRCPVRPADIGVRLFAGWGPRA